MRPIVQPMIIRMYKVVGIAALGTILIGLIAFMTVNVFYFFDKTWVRPVILTRGHERVLEANKALTAAQLERGRLDAEIKEVVNEGVRLDRVIKTEEAFEADYGSAALQAPHDASGVILRRERDKAGLERQDAFDRKSSLEARIRELKGHLAEQDALIAQLRDSPYIQARDGRVTVAFVPYRNLENVHPGATLYGCEWSLIRCTQVGKVNELIEGEVTESHPHDGSVQRGLMVEIELTSPRAAELPVLFVGARPFWLL
jgi:hypothetical protein